MTTDERAASGLGKCTICGEPAQMAVLVGAPNHHAAGRYELRCPKCGAPVMDSVKASSMTAEAAFTTWLRRTHHADHIAEELDKEQHGGHTSAPLHCAADHETWPCRVSLALDRLDELVAETSTLRSERAELLAALRPFIDGRLYIGMAHHERWQQAAAVVARLAGEGRAVGVSE